MRCAQVAKQPWITQPLAIAYYAFCVCMEFVYHHVFQTATVKQQYSYVTESMAYLIVDTVAKVINPCFLATLVAVSEGGVLMHGSAVRREVRPAQLTCREQEMTLSVLTQWVSTQRAAAKPGSLFLLKCLAHLQMAQRQRKARTVVGGKL